MQFLVKETPRRPTRGDKTRIPLTTARRSQGFHNQAMCNNTIVLEDVGHEGVELLAHVSARWRLGRRVGSLGLVFNGRAVVLTLCSADLASAKGKKKKKKKKKRAG